MNKVVIFDWGGVVMHMNPTANNHNEAIIRAIKSFNNKLSDEEAFNLYVNTLKDEYGTYISVQNDSESKIKWLERIKHEGKIMATIEEIQNKFIEEMLKVGSYDEVIKYIYSLKEKCKIGLFSDLIYIHYPALKKQLDLTMFDYVWLSYLIHFRKNTEDAFKVVERDLQIPPENILFIDDTPRNIKNADNRGWNTCLARGYELDKIKEAVEYFLEKDLVKGKTRN